MIVRHMLFKKKAQFLILLCLLPTGVLRSQWKTAEVSVSENLNSISLMNDNKGWVVGNKGTMIYKFNDVWIKYPCITENDLYSVCMVAKDNCWAVGAKGTILHFNGTQWEKKESLTKENLYSVSFRDEWHGIAVGNNGTILICEKGSWSVNKTGIVGDLYAVSDTKDMSLTGGGQEFCNTPLLKVDGGSGNKLTKIFDPGYSFIRSLSVTDKNSIWTVGMAGLIFHYDGINWKNIRDIGNIPTLNSVFFIDKNRGMAVGYGGTILTYSENGWTKEASPVDVRLNGAIVSKETYYAVGNNGTIVYRMGSPEDVSDPNRMNGNTLRLDTYPNPSSDILNIIIPDQDGFAASLISIINGNGQVVLSKKIDAANTGLEYQVNTSVFNNGLYIVKITSTGSLTATGKFIVKH